MMRRHRALLQDAVVAIMLVESSLNAASILASTTMKGVQSPLHATFPCDPDAEFVTQQQLVLVRLGLKGLVDSADDCNAAAGFVGDAARHGSPSDSDSEAASSNTNGNAASRAAAPLRPGAPDFPEWHLATGSASASNPSAGDEDFTSQRQSHDKRPSDMAEGFSHAPPFDVNLDSVDALLAGSYCPPSPPLRPALPCRTDAVRGPAPAVAAARGSRAAAEEVRPRGSDWFHNPGHNQTPEGFVNPLDASRFQAKSAPVAPPKVMIFEPSAESAGSQVLAGYTSASLGSGYQAMRQHLAPVTSQFHDASVHTAAGSVIAGMKRNAVSADLDRPQQHVAQAERSNPSHRVNLPPQPDPLLARNDALRASSSSFIDAAGQVAELSRPQQGLVVLPQALHDFSDVGALELE
jgi:hypothetical protein